MKTPYKYKGTEYPYFKFKDAPEATRILLEALLYLKGSSTCSLMETICPRGESKALKITLPIPESICFQGIPVYLTKEPYTCVTATLEFPASDIEMRNELKQGDIK